MATQKRFTNYKVPTESFPLGEEKIGLFKPGRYSGFDRMETSDNINLRITHSGIIKKSLPDGSIVELYGSILTPTGLVIHEDGPINVNLPPTTPPAEDQIQIRKFMLICEHNYQPIQGGVPASYFIIASSDFGETIPELPNPDKQVALGIITKDYNANEITYEKRQAPLLADRTPLELYNIIKDYIQVPDSTELPDIEAMIAKAIELNKPRVIVTGEFDIADSNSAKLWTNITHDKYVDINGGHNLDKHQIKFRQIRLGSGNAYIDVELIPDQGLQAEDIRWTWDNTRVLATSWVNDQDQGAKTFPIIECRGDVEGSTPGSTAKRFQVLEAASAAQAVSLKILIENKGIIKNTGNLGDTYLKVDKTEVKVNTIYPYPQSVKITASGPWTASSDSGQVQITPTSGEGDANMTVSIPSSSGNIEGIITISLTGTTLTKQVRASRDNTIF